MPRRNTNRNRYSRRNMSRGNKASKRLEDKAQREQEILRIMQTSEYRDHETISYFIGILAAGKCVKGTVLDLLNSNMGTEYNRVKIEAFDVEVKCDKVMFCFSDKTNRYVWLGIDNNNPKEGYLLFYAHDFNDVQGSMNIENIAIESVTNSSSMDIISYVDSELRNIEQFYNMQLNGDQIVYKDELFSKKIIETKLLSVLD